jgi:uncharacterized protein YigA (DUF484 family)
MSTQEKHDNFSDFVITEEMVADYLHNHPDFFTDHEDLLLKMQIHHEVGPAVSLVEHQVKLLRQQNEQLKSKLMDLVEVARDNDRLTERMMRLTLQLVDTDNLDSLIHVLTDTIFTEFQADSISIQLFDQEKIPDSLPQEIRINRDDPQMEIFENFFRVDRPLCGRLKTEQLEFLFGESKEHIASAVLIPLGRHSELGMLAIGSEDETRFHPGMGTVYLKQLGSLVSTLLRRYID